jgi:hypothetical protein
MSSMGLNTWQPIEVLVSLRPHAGHGFHPVFPHRCECGVQPHYLVFFWVCSSSKSSLDGNAKGRGGLIECDWHSTQQDFEVLNCVKW